MNCPTCGAPMRLNSDADHLNCDYCKSIFFPAKDDEGVSVLAVSSGESCPVCAVPLMHAALAKIRMRYCTRCRGMLIPMGVFIALVEELRAGDQGTLIAHTPDPHDLQRGINCPHCHHHMDTHFYNGPGNVVIDDCDNCELNWLDHGELMRIVRAPDYSNVRGEPNP
ncbi:MAG TPA: zf-TFIIB domain-containing protein [Terracidiphilus sp.]|jgi:Zn-finger nucleic acid-binding protein